MKIADNPLEQSRAEQDRAEQSRVILYGVRQIKLRREVEFFLDDDYEIVGYSDGHYSEDVLDGKTFYRPVELKNAEFDYIIPLSYSKETLRDMKRQLAGEGVPRQKIIAPHLIIRPNIEALGDVFSHIESDYHGEAGVIFGLSYSRYGILEKALDPPFFNCSWDSMDFYYNYRFFRYMKDRGFLASVKRAMLVFPYCQFNRDSSVMPIVYTAQNGSGMARLNDWHNAEEYLLSYEYIANYRMFFRKMADFYKPHWFHRHRRDVYSGEDGAADLKHTWTIRRDTTVEENRKIFSRFISELCSLDIETDYIVPPFFLRGISEESLTAFYQWKEWFYAAVKEICGEDGPRVFDYSEAFADKREYFFDCTHMNTAGAEAFTELLNREVLGENQ